MKTCLLDWFGRYNSFGWLRRWSASHWSQDLTLSYQSIFKKVISLTLYTMTDTNEQEDQSEWAEGNQFC
jgi:hypothetical protein